MNELLREQLTAALKKLRLTVEGIRHGLPLMSVSDLATDLAPFLEKEMAELRCTKCNASMPAFLVRKTGLSRS